VVNVFSYPKNECENLIYENKKNRVSFATHLFFLQQNYNP